jgi:hypothetical protein
MEEDKVNLNQVNKNKNKFSKRLNAMSFTMRSSFASSSTISAASHKG